MSQVEPSAAAAAPSRYNATLIAVSAEGFLTRLGFGMVGFALPLYALSLGMNIAEIGLLYALRSVVTLAVKPMFGWAADRFGRKPTLVVAVVMRCIVGFLLIFATLPWHLYVIRILGGAMTAARDPSASALIAEHANKRNMASAYAWYTTARDVGKSLGFGAAGLAISYFGGYQLVFIIAFATSLLALFTVIRYVRESRKLEPNRAAEAPSAEAAAPSPIHYRGLLGYASVGMMVALSAEMMRGLYPVIATQYAHLTEAQAGIAASAAALAILLAGPFFGWLSDRVSRKLALGARSLANASSSILYLAQPNFAGFLAGRVLDDTGKAAFRPAWGAMLAEISDADPARRGRVISFVDTASTLGEILGPLLAALIITLFGIPAMLAVRIGLSVLTEVQALIVFRSRKPPPTINNVN